MSVALTEAATHVVQSRVAWVTGAGHAIGRATAIALAVDGYEVWLSDLNNSGMVTTAKMIGDCRGVCSSAICDVTDPLQVDAAVSRIYRESNR